MGENDKLLICIALILLITIVWTILIGIIYKLAERNSTIVSKKKIYVEDDEDDEDDYSNYLEKKEDEYETVKVVETKTKTSPKKKTKSNSSKTKTITKVVNTDKETYVRVRFARAKEDTIYMIPKNTIFDEGDKIKINVDGEIKNATVTKGNYRRDRYKNKDIEVTNLVLEKR